MLSLANGFCAITISLKVRLDGELWWTLNM